MSFRRRCTVAVSALLATALVSPLPSWSNPPTDPPPSAPAQPTAPAEQVKVMVMLKDQPSGAGNEKANLADLDKDLATWQRTFGLKVDRKFGLLAKGFSAWMAQDKMAELAAQPGIASVKPVKLYYPTVEIGEETKSITARKDYGVDGRGTVVSIIDTGIDITHQDMRLDSDAVGSAKLKPSAGYTEKVPYGYNFADKNNDALDRTSSMHGMHVAGITAANGPGEFRVKGVAPNAQLLAMKVFSNDTANPGAQEDDIVAAIEQSVRLKADVINMSLGSPGGLDHQAQGSERAIANAEKAGVQVIVSAGNDGLSSSAGGNTVNDLGTVDNSIVGSPSTAPGAWSVASVNSNTAVRRAAKATWEGGESAPSYDLQAGTFDGKPHELVFVAEGKPEQIGTDAVKGKWALIKRGAIAFSEKVQNAIAKGATGVVIFNNAGKDDIPGMAGLDGFTIPVVGMGQADGQQLADINAAGKTVTFQLLDAYKVVDGPEAGQPSSFTSWGSSPDLNFKPQIAGIGGNVFSTLNKNSYGTMSGTSMSAPHVAGVASLMRQHYAKAYPQLSAREANTRLRTALSNTAKILEQADGVPQAPRQIGAGLVQTADAMKSEVLATVDGSPTVALKEFNAPKTVTVTLTNVGKTNRTFTTDQTCVLAEHQGDDPSTMSCNANESAKASATSVTVPAGKTATVAWTVTPQTGKAHWIEGWFKLTSTDDQPSLSLPYLGFVGDWNAEPIVDTPVYSGKGKLVEFLGNNTPNVTQLWSYVGSRPTPLTPGQNAISPNGDDVRDVVYANAALLRSAETLKYQVIDASGAVVRELGEQHENQHLNLSDIKPDRPNAVVEGYDYLWNGTKWDTAKGQFTNLADGTYTLRIQARLSSTRPFQNHDMPFTVDRVAPKLALAAHVTEGVTSYTVTASDAASGIDPDSLKVSGVADAKVTSDKAGTWTVTLPTTPDATMSIAVSDYAGNSATQHELLGTSGAKLTYLNRYNHRVNLESKDPVTGKPLVDANSTVPVEGRTSADVTKVTVNGKEVPVADRAFATRVTVAEGTTDITVDAFNADGKKLSGDAAKVILDATAPTVDLTGTPMDANGKVITDADGKVTVKGKVSDNQAVAADMKVFVQDGTSPTPIAADGTFTQEVTVAATDTDLTVWTYDGVNMAKESKPLVRAAAAASGLAITFDDPALAGSPTQPFGKSTAFLPRGHKTIKVTGDKHVLTVSGQFTAQPGSFTVAGKPVTVDANRRFSVDIPLNQGITKVNYKVTTAAGEVAADFAWRYLYDTKVPGVSLDNPMIAEDGAVYIRKQETDTTFSGAVWDNAFGYRLAINGDVVTEFTNIWDPGAQINRKKFDKTFGVADGHKVLFGLYDKAGNAVEQVIPYIYDDGAPDVAVAGVTDGQLNPKTATITATDPHLKDLVVTINGKPVSQQATKVVPAPGSSLVVAGDPADPDPGEGTASAQLSDADIATKAKTAQAAAAVTAQPADDKPQTQLVATVDLTKIASGQHVLKATASDRAGNVTSVPVRFGVDKAPIIGGPNKVTINPDEDLLAQLRTTYPVTDDVDKGLQINADLTGLTLDKYVPVVLSATDSVGNVTKRTVQVLLQRPLTTLTGQCGEMTARFAKGDGITITCRTLADGTIVVDVANTLLTVNGVLTLNVPTDRDVYLVVDGRLVGPLRNGVANGKLVLNSSSKATYKLFKRGQQAPPPPEGPKPPPAKPPRTGN